MLTRRCGAAMMAAAVAVGTAGLWAAPVLAGTPPPCSAWGGCGTPPNSATIGAAASIPGVPANVIPGNGIGGWTRDGTVPICNGPTSTGEALGVGGNGVAGWTDPGGVNHLTRGGLGTTLPPLSEYLITADYSRSAKVVTAAIVPTPTPPAAATKQECQYGPWLFAGFGWVPIQFPPPTPAQVVPDAHALAAQVLKGLQGGSVATAPAKDALVGLATQAWVTHTNVSPVTPVVAHNTQLGSIVDGRQVVLTVVVLAQLNSVTWDWGEGPAGTSQSSGPGMEGSPGPGSNISHTYYDVSVHGEHPTPYPVINTHDQIPVSATMEIGVYAYAIAQTAQGRQQWTLPGYPYSLALSVNPTWIVVGQIESIPVCPTPTNCS